MKSIALIGDFNLEVTAHQAIPKALQLAADQLSTKVRPVWIHSDDVANSDLGSYDGFWCVPASPYANRDGALTAIKFARENSIPFLGTCGGYQHAVLEYARRVLGHTDADITEVNPDTSLPLINALLCRLDEQQGAVSLHEDSLVADLYGQLQVTEKYQCGFGVNAQYLHLFHGTDMRFVGFDQENDPRVFELYGHPFFIGTAFQPERSALGGENHPLITAFVRAASQ